MNNVNIDTAKIRQCGNDIINLSNEIGDKFDDIFGKLIKMPKFTKEWTGKAAEQYAAKIQADRFNYVIFKNDLYKYGKKLVDYANMMESKLSRMGD